MPKWNFAIMIFFLAENFPFKNCTVDRNNNLHLMIHIELGLCHKGDQGDPRLEPNRFA